MKLLALVYSVVTLASLAIGTHAYDSARLRGAIEAINFLTEDNDTCSELGGLCETNDPNSPGIKCCPGALCQGPGASTCKCGCRNAYCYRNPDTCCPGLVCDRRGQFNWYCIPEGSSPPQCLGERERCDGSKFPCCDGLVCDRGRCERDRQAEVLFAVDTNKD